MPRMGSGGAMGTLAKMLKKRSLLQRVPASMTSKIYLYTNQPNCTTLIPNNNAIVQSFICLPVSLLLLLF